MAEVMGTVDALWRFPVKSMLGEHLEELVVSRRGVVGDRAFGLVDLETGKIISAKHPRIGGGLLGFRARYIQAPVDDAVLPPVEITLPNGSKVRSDDDDVDDVFSRELGRPVRLSSEPPAHRVIETEIPGGTLDSGIGFFAPGTFQDGAPLHLLTTATLSALQSASPSASIDRRRFRANAVVRTQSGLEGFVENDWVGRVVKLGIDIKAPIVLAVPRCIVTVLAQEDLPRDNEVLKVIAHNNRLEVPVLGPSPCAGVYGTVHTGGVLRRGDVVAIADPEDDEPVAADDPATQAGFTAMAEALEQVMAQLRPH